jgi:hypothetical protein
MVLDYTATSKVTTMIMEPKKDEPRLDEEVWQAWIKKNEGQDRLRFARRMRVLALVIAIGGLAALLWRFA